jgi:uncharacterized protein (TIGR02271 family)
VVAEQVRVDRDTVTLGGVRVRKVVDERQVVVDEPVLREEVSVERRSINRFVAADKPPKCRQEGDTTIVPVLEEVLVVQKRLLLKEEVRITKVRRTERGQEVVTKRAERAVIEKLDERGDVVSPAAERTSRTR